MAEVFGLPYTQVETYYVMETTPGAKIFLGLRDDADIATFEEEARAALGGEPFEPERHVQAHAAERHRLYLIPAGTVHASGAGNLVLEISATPYLYTLRFYDWLRRDLEERLRPVHLEHAFANLDPSRRGAAVTRDLIQEPQIVRSGPGWTELQLGRPPGAVLRGASARLRRRDRGRDGGRFHVLNLVDGDEATIETEAGDVHPLAYAETIVVPAAVGPYRHPRPGQGRQGLRRDEHLPRSRSAAATSARRVSTSRPRRSKDLRQAGARAAGTRAELLGAILAAARSVADGATHVGVATPGPFDYERGICTIRGVGSSRRCSASISAPSSRVFSRHADPRAIRFLNDAEAFLLGEAAAGAARGRSRAIGITLGTGLGSAFLVEGKIVRDGPGRPARRRPASSHVPRRECGGCDFRPRPSRPLRRRRRRRPDCGARRRRRSPCDRRVRLLRGRPR